MFLAFLRLRYSSPLFRLPDAAAISAQMKLLNTGPNQASLPCLNIAFVCVCLKLAYLLLYCVLASKSVVLKQGARHARHGRSLLLYAAAIGAPMRQLITGRRQA